MIRTLPRAADYGDLGELPRGEHIVDGDHRQDRIVPPAHRPGEDKRIEAAESGHAGELLETVGPGRQVEVARHDDRQRPGQHELRERGHILRLQQGVRGPRAMHADHFDGGAVHVELDPPREQAERFGIAGAVDPPVGLDRVFGEDDDAEIADAVRIAGIEPLMQRGEMLAVTSCNMTMSASVWLRKVTTSSIRSFSNQRLKLATRRNRSASGPASAAAPAKPATMRPTLIAASSPARAMARRPA